jgi:hypothetical protein
MGGGMSRLLVAAAVASLIAAGTVEARAQQAGRIDTAPITGGLRRPAIGGSGATMPSPVQPYGLRPDERIILKRQIIMPRYEICSEDPRVVPRCRDR